MIGDVLLECEWAGQTLAGFENHAGRTYLEDGAEPLGRVLAGFGNDGASGYEGCKAGRVVGTYLHGPLLPRNPWFADWMLAEAAAHQLGGGAHVRAARRRARVAGARRLRRARADTRRPLLGGLERNVARRRGAPRGSWPRTQDAFVSGIRTRPRTCATGHAARSGGTVHISRSPPRRPGARRRPRRSARARRREGWDRPGRAGGSRRWRRRRPGSGASTRRHRARRRAVAARRPRRRRSASARCAESAAPEVRVALAPVVLGQRLDPLARHRAGSSPEPIGE